MDNYLLLGHILKCSVIPKDAIHPELWIGANRKWRVVPRDRIARVQHNKVCLPVIEKGIAWSNCLKKPRTEDEQQAAEKRLVKRQSERKRKLAEASIDYDFDKVAYVRFSFFPS